MTLRSRLLLGLTMIFVAIVAAGAFTVVSQRNQLNDQVDDQLLATPLPPSVRPQPPGTRPQPAQTVDSDTISDLFIAVVDSDGEYRAVVEGQLLDDMPDVDAIVAALPAGTMLTTVDGVNGMSTFRVRYEPSTERSLITIIAVPIDDVNATVRQLTFTLVGVAAAILLVLALIGSWVSRFGLRPISEMTDVAEAISSGERERRADEQIHSTEAGRLARSFNVMLDERDASDARLRQFVSNASHELRTPLTSIRGYLDLYSAGGFRQPGELDDVVRRLQTEAERMTLLVEDLLLLAKFDEQQPLDVSRVDVVALLTDVAALAEAAHPARHIDVSGLAHGVEADVDRLRLHQAVAGLVHNAVAHTPGDASIRITAGVTDEQLHIAVIDTGLGLTAAEAKTVFDRFARGDSSRARTTGGSGLGLSITKAIIEAHGGTIAVVATPSGGATFDIRLPATPAPG